MAIEARLYSENIGFPLFGSQQDWAVENGGCGSNGGFSQFCFNVQQKHQLQQQQQLQNQQQMNHNLCFENSVSSANSIMASCSQTMEAQAAKQRQEIDEYIRLQNERLRLVLQQQTKQQLAMLLKKFESKTLVMLKQKDDEITQANQRRMELEDFLRKLESEKLAWQRVAQDNEAMVVSLNNTLEQFKQQASCCFINGAEDVQSCCGSTGDEDQGEEAESKNGGFHENQRLKTMSVCRSCNSRSACVLFLPCRHLCSCKVCEAVLDCCPVCRAPKKASIEALII